MLLAGCKSVFLGYASHRTAGGYSLICELGYSAACTYSREGGVAEQRVGSRLVNGDSTNTPDKTLLIEVSTDSQAAYGDI